MKAFEEWDRKEYGTPTVKHYKTLGLTFDSAKHRRKTWRAALEWAISKGVQNEESSQTEIEIMAWDLEEELEDSE